MPSPTRSDMHVDTPLTNFTLASESLQKDFVLFEAAPVLPVDKQTDKYYVYDVGAWNRSEMQPRGSSEESHGSGWSLSTTTYDAKRYAVHKDFDWSDKANADSVLSLDQDAADWLANQARIKGELLFGANIFKASTWTTDWDGASSKDYSSSEVLYWNNSSGDPQADHYHLAGIVKGLSGHWPNVMVVGSDVHKALVVNPQVRDAIKYTSATGGKMIEDFLAAYFGVEKYLVAGAFYNSAAEGASASLGYILDPDDVWCGYVSQEVKPKTYTACKTFAYRNGGSASKGIQTRSFDIQSKTSTRYEIEVFWDVKVTAADAGYFIDEAVS